MCKIDYLNICIYTRIDQLAKEETEIKKMYFWMHMKVFKQIITDIYCRIDNANILN